MHQSHQILTRAASPGGASDQELLREYATHGTPDSFARLVERHAELVYSAAFRQTGSHPMAQDVAQAVFIILARKAASLSGETILAGWLFRAVRYAALDARKIEARRQIREQEAAQMQLTDSIKDTPDEWERLAPLLDEALAALGTTDRHAILLRFFEKKSFGEIGAGLGGNENSARVRVVRAVDKLRGFFQRRGIAVSAAALSGVLLNNAVQAAPPGLMSTLAGCASAGQTTVAGIVRAVLHRLRWRRLIRVGVALAIMLLLTGSTMLAIRWREASQAAELAEAGRSVRNLMIAIDRTYTLPDPNGFVALIQFRDDEAARFGTVLADYIRAQWLFRQEMQRAFNVRQRTFNATFRELCIGQRPLPATYIRSDRAATNIMMARYPVHFVKAGPAWKWDLFDGFSREAREQLVTTLRHKTVVLDRLARQIGEGTSTNVVEILEVVRGTTP